MTEKEKSRVYGGRRIRKEKYQKEKYQKEMRLEMHFRVIREIREWRRLNLWLCHSSWQE